MQVVVIILGMLVALFGGALIYLVTRPKKDDTQSALLIKEDLRALSEDITKLKDGVQTQINDRMEKSQVMMMGSLQKQSSESNKIITEITRNLTEL